MLKIFLIAASIFHTASQAEARSKKVAKAGVWDIYCDSSKSECSAIQGIKYHGKNIANIIGIPMDNNEVVAGLVLQLPTTTDLKNGVVVTLDGRFSRKYADQLCAPQYCQVNVGLTKELLNAEFGKVEYYFAASPAVKRSFTFSLYGFSAAIEEVRKRGYPSN